MLQLRGAPPGPRALGWLHLGRVLGYTVLGAVAGALGAHLLPWLPMERIGIWVQWLAALVLVLLGVSYLARPAAGCAVQRLNGEDARTGALQGLRRGLIWALLPCGALYALLFLAAASGSALTGALLLAAFGLGTVPLLAGGAGALQQLLQPRRLRGLAAGVLILLGLVTASVASGGTGADGMWCRVPAAASLQHPGAMP
jgi:uncharacterized protein